MVTTPSTLSHYSWKKELLFAMFAKKNVTVNFVSRKPPNRGAAGKLMMCPYLDL